MNIFELISLVFNTALINPTINLLLSIYKVLDVIGIPGTLGFSIIGLTVVIRGVLWPLTTKQLESAKKMADLRPKLEELKKRFGQDKMRLQQEHLLLYKEHGVNPASGCLPLIIQIPVFIALYQVLIKLLSSSGNGDALGAINQVAYHPIIKLSGPLDASFFGFNLAQKPGDWAQAGLVLLLIPVVTSLLQFVQSKMMAAPKSTQKLEPKNEKGKEKEEELATALQTQMTYLMPVMIGVFSYGFPLGLSLYWNTFSIFGIFQQYRISGFGGLSDTLAFIKNYGRKSS